MNPQPKRDEYHAIIQTVGLDRLEALLKIDIRLRQRIAENQNHPEKLIAAVLAAATCGAAILTGLGLSDRELTLLQKLISDLGEDISEAGPSS